jgi:hypothetical protein
MRPRDEDGNLLPMAHRRVNMIPFQKAALDALAEDPRSCSLPVARKLLIIDMAVDHVVDGFKVPKFVFAKDPYRPQNHYMQDIWRITVRACQQVKAVQLG